MPGRQPSFSQSQHSLISMQELDPSPVEESPAGQAVDIEKGDGSYFPQPTPPQSSYLGLSGGGNGHNFHWWASRVQQYSSYPFALYLGFHITNTSLIPLLTRSVPASENYLLLTRPFYQSPLMEPLMIAGPLIAHIGSGLALRIHRRRQNVKRYGAETFAERRQLKWPPLSTQALLGYALLPLVAGHALVNRIIPLKVEGGSSGVGLGFVAHGFAKHPVVANIGYAVLVAVGSWHAVTGMARYLRLGPETVTESGDYGRRQRAKRWWTINLASAVTAALWMAGGLGIVGRGGKGGGWEAKGWDELYRRTPVIGPYIS